ncbi:MAG: class I SAM-dependent methyltransferase [Alphaproteobacteria bacterium]|nr:class I SAM-dependent methyltransferase [Alphaproteobacteria bacterium]
MTDAVRDQYEDLPYPPRNPEDERQRLVTGSPSQIVEIDHYLYAGARDWAEPFRVLVAGGGTGDALIMMAQQLADRGCPAEIHYLDLSAASRAIAEERARIRGLTNIEFHTGSLLDAGNYGTFDYIDCCGVLHHLPEPAAGFRALAGALKPDSGVGLMVYGELGRTGVYHAQEMLRMVAGDGSNAERVGVARKLVESLPPTNWLKRNQAIGDYKREDAALFDLLLHSQDRAYRVPELAAELDQASMRPVAFIEPALYDPDTFVRDPELRRRLASLSWLERCAFAELLSGNLRKHTVYCVPTSQKADTVAKPTDEAAPVLKNIDGPALAGAIGPDGGIKVSGDGMEMGIRLPPMAPAILRHVDGARTIGEIRAAIGAGEEDFHRQFAALYNALNGMNLMLLRYPG